MPTTPAVGVDGCRAGWIAAILPPRGRARFQLHTGFGDLLAAHPEPAILAVDMPIGLLDARQPGGRPCDRLARQLLGRPRGSSVFSPPLRQSLAATRYEEVRTEGLTIQAFNILPRIREVDAAMTPALQARVIEAHPELAWLRLGEGAIAAPKRSAEGRQERLRRLGEAVGGPRLVDAIEGCAGAWPRAQVQPDDLVDAAVLALVARRYSRGEAQRLPETPETDARGLRLEIWS